MISFKKWINLIKARMYWIIILIVATTIVLAQTNYNPIGNNNVLPTSNYNPITQNYQNYTITSPSFNSQINNTNLIIINITNNITTFVTNTNNITNNITTLVNLSNNYYIDNNFTNNITNIIENNVTTYVNFSNNFYSAWLTIINNISNNITLENNITQYMNTTNIITIENNFTNNITNEVYITNNISNNINVSVIPISNDTIINNISVILNVYNITNDFNYYYNNPISLSKYLLTYTNSSNISFNETSLNTTIINICLRNDINYYNLTLNSLIINNSNNINSLNAYGNINNYFQLNVQNLNDGIFSSSDIVATANNGNEENNYIDMGINNQYYSNPEYSSGYGNDGYLLLNGNNLGIITANENTTINFYVAGTKSENIRMSINDSYTKIYNSLQYNNYYGEIYFITTYNIVLTTRYVWYNLTNITGGELNGFYINNNELVCNQSGLYLITYNIANTLNAIDNLKYQIVINNVSISKSLGGIKIATGDVETIEKTFLQRLNVNDKIKLQVSNDDTDNKVLTIYNENIIVSRIGD
jgi:hypothetical protein